jgi:hypothetical protein
MGFIAKLVLMLAVVAGGIWVWMMLAPAMQPAQTANTAETSSEQQADQQNAPADAGAGASTDAALESDLTQLDIQLGAAEDASLSAESFSDQPIEQSE